VIEYIAHSIRKKKIMKPGNTVIVISGSRLRRVSDDGKRLLDQAMNEGALVDVDKPAKVTHVIPSADKTKMAYLIEMKHNNVTLHGWVYDYEITVGK
jgi:hypothetical protein